MNEFGYKRQEKNDKTAKPGCHVLILVGAIGIVVSIVMEIFMPDMARTIKVFVGSVVAVSIGIGGEIAVRQLGGSMINPEYIMQGIEYVKISI